jgi:uncharacterized protein (DUF2141 family)
LEAAIVARVGSKDERHHLPKGIALFAALISVVYSVQIPPPALADTTGTGELVIAISGSATDDGLMMVALMNTADTFENDSEAFRNDSVPVKDGKATAIFSDLPFGDYAVKIYQDENSNGKLDTSFVGFPKEAFGFSNDAMGRFGPPNFEQAKFEFTSNPQQIEIHTK